MEFSFTGTAEELLALVQAFTGAAVDPVKAAEVLALVRNNTAAVEANRRKAVDALPTEQQ